MRRRTFVTSVLVALAAPAIAGAQTAPTPAPAQEPPIATAPAVRAPLPRPVIEPHSDLERALIAATNADATEEHRATFRSMFLESEVALALSATTPEAPPRQIQVTLHPNTPPAPACVIFTSSARATEVMGANAPRVVLTGRQALERTRGANVIVNINLSPVLTLEAEDVERFLALPAPNATAAPAATPTPPSDTAGPTQ